MRQPSFILPVIFMFTLIVLLAGCDGTFSPDDGSAPAPAYGPGGGFGATQGGVQDMGLARELVANGKVPPAEAFTVEGMFSEHDLPLDGDTSAAILNLRGGLGLTPGLDGGQEAGWIQVGMSSNIDPENFNRPAQSFVACVDVSGSMGWDYANQENEYPRPGALARGLLRAMTLRLGQQDRVSIVTYGSNVNLLLSPVAADDPSVQAAIDLLSTGGVTNMEQGLQLAYQVAHDEAALGTHEVRVLLFTDIQPNVGATDAGTFSAMARDGAAENIGLTVYGVGVGMRQEVMNAITSWRGGNAFSVFDHDDVDALMEDSWPWMVVPIAHELELAITPSAQATVAATYGFPGQEEDGLGLTVASVFPSNRKGALLARLEAVPGTSLRGQQLQGVLSYKTVADEPVVQNLSWTFPQEISDQAGDWFDQPSVGKTVTLAQMVSGMKSAAEIYLEDKAGAVAIMELVCQRLAAPTPTNEDEALTPERQLAQDLLQLMREGAPQGDMYGEF